MRLNLNTVSLPLHPGYLPLIGPEERLALEQVTVDYGATRAVDEVSFTVGDGEILCLLGPSGSGKSSLLRVIAGVERPSCGRVLIDHAECAGPHRFVEPERRRIGMVFQDYALFPHLTVAANVAFGLKGRPARDIDRIVAAMLDRVDLRRYAGSYPHMLSGGERQRVALARALAPAPRVLLMDEPFSSLDGRLRDQVREQTLELLRDTRTTTVIVTHDPDEAMRVADRIALLRDGRLEQCGPPEELYLRPATRFAARFFGDLNEIAGTCRGGVVHTPVGSFEAPDLRDGAQALVCIRPQAVRVGRRPAGIAAHVVRAEFRGEVDHLVLAVAGLTCPLTARAFGRTRLEPGDAVYVEVPHEDVLIVPGADGPVLACQGASQSSRAVTAMESR
jgi:iron(III) transport system ATP-binding protein